MNTYIVSKIMQKVKVKVINQNTYSEMHIFVLCKVSFVHGVFKLVFLQQEGSL